MENGDKTAICDSNISDAPAEGGEANDRGGGEVGVEREPPVAAEGGAQATTPPAVEEDAAPTSTATSFEEENPAFPPGTTKGRKSSTFRHDDLDNEKEDTAA